LAPDACQRTPLHLVTQAAGNSDFAGLCEVLELPVAPLLAADEAPAASPANGFRHPRGDCVGSDRRRDCSHQPRTRKIRWWAQ